MAQEKNPGFDRDVLKKLEDPRTGVPLFEGESVNPPYIFEIAPVPYVVKAAGIMPRDTLNFAIARKKHSDEPPLLLMYSVKWGFKEVRDESTLRPQYYWNVKKPSQPMDHLHETFKLAYLVRWNGDFLKQFYREVMEYEHGKMKNHPQPGKWFQEIIPLLHAMSRKGYYDKFFKTHDINQNLVPMSDFERAIRLTLPDPNPYRHRLHGTIR